MKTNYYLTHFAVREAMAARCRPLLWAEAMAYLKRTGDVDGWHVMLYGA